MNQVQIIAHRGDSWERHENTMPAFERAIAGGADGIEFDLRMTRDRQWIIHHNADVIDDGRPLRIGRLTLTELGRVRIGPDRDPLPRLDDFLLWARAQKVSLIFDIKDRLGVPELIAAIERAGLSSSIVLSSFHRSVLKELEVARPDWPRALIVGNPRSHVARKFLLGSIIRWSVRHRLTALHLDEHWVVPSVVARLQEIGFRLAVWTVDDPIRMTLLSALGIDALITNRPDLACITLRSPRGSTD